MKEPQKKLTEGNVHSQRYEEWNMDKTMIKFLLLMQNVYFKARINVLKMVRIPKTKQKEKKKKEAN